MNPPVPQAPSGALDKLGQALGVALGFIGTAPLGEMTYPYFFEYAIKYTDRQYWNWMEIGWHVCLFFLIFAFVWATLVGIVTVTQKAALTIVLGLRISRERSRWK